MQLTNQKNWGLNHIEPISTHLYEFRGWQWETHVESTNVRALGFAKVQWNVHSNGLAELCTGPGTVARIILIRNSR